MQIWVEARERAGHTFQADVASGRGETPICGATDARGIQPDFLDASPPPFKKSAGVHARNWACAARAASKSPTLQSSRTERERGNQVTEYVAGCREETRKESECLDCDSGVFDSSDKLLVNEMFNRIESNSQHNFPPSVFPSCCSNFNRFPPIMEVA